MYLGVYHPMVSTISFDFQPGDNDPIWRADIIESREKQLPFISTTTIPRYSMYGLCTYINHNFFGQM